MQKKSWFYWRLAQICRKEFGENWLGPMEHVHQQNLGEQNSAQTMNSNCKAT